MRKPWNKHPGFLEICKQRGIARWRPRIAATLAADAETHWRPRLEHAGLPPEIITLVMAYLGVSSLGRPLIRSELELLPGLDNPVQHHRLCCAIVWALLDPIEAKAPVTWR